MLVLEDDVGVVCADYDVAGGAGEEVEHDVCGWRWRCEDVFADWLLGQKSASWVQVC